jgi:hypothetical protein
MNPDGHELPDALLLGHIMGTLCAEEEDRVKESLSDPAVVARLERIRQRNIAEAEAVARMWKESSAQRTRWERLWNRLRNFWDAVLSLLARRRFPPGLVAAISFAGVITSIGFALAALQLKDAWAHAAAADALARDLSFELSKRLRPAPSSSPQGQASQFDQAQTVRAIPGFSEKANRLALILDTYFGPAFFTAFEVIWEKGAAGPPRTIWRDKQPLEPVLMHDYQLPGPGSKKVVTVELVFDTTSRAQAASKVRSTVRRTIPILLTSAGIQLAPEGLAVAITSPSPDGATVPYVFSLNLDVSVSDAMAASLGSVPDALYVLARPLDGPEDLAHVYCVESVAVPLSELGISGRSRQAPLELPISLKRILDESMTSKERRTGSGMPPPSRFEILVVQLRDRFAEWAIPVDEFKQLEAQGGATVRASCTVNLKADAIQPRPEA